MVANPNNDLFDFYYAQEVMTNPLLVARANKTHLLLGQNLGRWYQLTLENGEITKLEHFKQAPVLKQGWGLQKLHFEQLKKRPAHEEPYPF
uniref:hypothetical protein n=1 Tax=Helicobacter vulpis TaxID=2316076 RepID=UPI0013CE3D08